MSDNERKCNSCGWENSAFNTHCYFCGNKISDDKERKIKRINKIWGRK